ncbi:MAG: hypothetical protein ACREB9_07815 [Thermoplasmata archaeon]
MTADLWINAADLKRILTHRHYLIVERGNDKRETVGGLSGSVSWARDMDGICLHSITCGEEDACEYGRVRVRRWTPIGMRPAGDGK